MKNSTLKTLSEQLKVHEGFRTRPYKCSAGKLTIGYGRNLEGVGISKAEAEYLLQNDIDDALRHCRKMFSHFDQLSEKRQIVLADMMFNMGYSELNKFRKMKAALIRKDYDAAAREMQDSKWYGQVGYRAQKLQKMMIEG